MGTLMKATAVMSALFFASPVSAQTCVVTKAQAVWSDTMPAEVKFHVAAPIPGCAEWTVYIKPATPDEAKAAYALVLAAVLSNKNIEVCFGTAAEGYENSCHAKWVNLQNF
jgi:hypothetical protein